MTDEKDDLPALRPEASAAGARGDRAEPRPEVTDAEARDRGPGQLVHYSELHVGPLPDPRTLQSYEQVCTGAADRIIAMAETQAAHRQALEAKVVASDCKAQDRGPILGFILALVVILTGVGLIWNGKSVEGLIALLSPLAVIVGQFVYSKKKQQKNLEQSRFKDSPAPPQAALPNSTDSASDGAASGVATAEADASRASGVRPDG